MKDNADLHPDSILMDFEEAFINAASLAFPVAAIRGCYFHLAQAQWRMVGTLHLKRQYLAEGEIKKISRKLLALAFVPPEDVIRAFVLIEAETTEDMEEYLKYIEVNYS